MGFQWLVGNLMFLSSDSVIRDTLVVDRATWRWQSFPRWILGIQAVSPPFRNSRKDTHVHLKKISTRAKQSTSPAEFQWKGARERWTRHKLPVTNQRNSNLPRCMTKVLHRYHIHDCSHYTGIGFIRRRVLLALCLKLLGPWCFRNEYG